MNNDDLYQIQEFKEVVEEFSEMLKQLLGSNADNIPNFINFDKMLIDALYELQSMCMDYGIIPLIDNGDDTYLCFQVENEKWCILNPKDKTISKKDSALEDLVD